MATSLELTNKIKFNKSFPQFLPSPPFLSHFNKKINLI